MHLEGAFGCLATIERAKGILMERHTIDEQQASRSYAPTHKGPAQN
jgi:hypothetical protein